jgi:hypothetical protein
MSITIRPRHAPRLREASPGDYAQIAALESRYGLETKSEDEWKHLWFNNPVYKAMRTRWPIGWVLETEDRQIVGYLGNIPLPYEFQGNPVITAIAHAWVVESPYRGYSVMMLDRYFDQDYVDLFLNNTVGAEALTAFQVFNSSPVPVGAWNQSAFWVPNYHGFASSWLKAKGWTRADALSYPLCAALAVQDLPGWPSLHRRTNGVEVQPVSDFDRRFDDFWQVLRNRCRNQLLAVRNSELLQWHFKYALPNRKVWVLTVQKGSGLAAYSIFYRQDSPKFGLKRVRLADYQSLDGDTGLLVPMLRYALKKCQKERIHMLEYIGLVPPIASTVEKLRPHQRDLPSWLYFYKARDSGMAQRLADPTAWKPCWFDGDACL